MEIIILISLIAAGLLLFIVEVFLIPGISLAGIGSAISLLAAVYYSFTAIGSTAGFITLGVSAVSIVIIIMWLMRSKTVDKYSLKKTLDYKENKVKKFNIKVGDEGVAITRLALIGNAEINGNIIEVRSAEGFIDENTLIYVERISGETIMVRKRQEN
ncbi:NfeD family protein [Phocaeicola paurosaccharolyticus]|uniref:NfeD family protein n=1 Tax=Phocaeicola paurosaccharolyticus TaxID=732242 RepID=UPI00046A672B|nr:NfeD family protein [Phocaeicola paurosaccharolyticus]